MDGWIKVNRKILEWQWYGDSRMVHLWMHLILSANHRDSKYMGMDVKRGQVVVGRKQLSSTLGISEDRIRTGLDRLEDGGCITRKTTNKYTIITICNYDIYQLDDNYESPTNPQQIPNKSPTNPHKQEYKEYLDINTTESNTNVLSSSVSISKSASADADQFLVFFNSSVEGSRIPKLKAMTDKRKSMLHARIKEYGKEEVAKAVRKAAASDFLNGDNSRGFRADFDWIFRPNNFPKILEGNYDNADRKASADRINSGHLDAIKALVSS